MVDDAPQSNRIAVGKLVVDLTSQEVVLTDSDIPADLRPQAAQLLVTLTQNAGRLVTKQSLMEAVWPDVVVTDDSIVQAVRDVRRALEDTDHQLIRTVRGKGYCLVQNDESPMQKSAGKTANAISNIDSIAATGSGKHKSLVLGTLLLTLLTITTLYLLNKAPTARSTETKTAASSAPGIAVLPFREFDTKTGIGDWLAEELVRDLARNGRLRVISQYSSFSVNTKDVSARQLGKILQARYLVDGHVIRKEEDVSLQVQLVDLTVDEVIWSESLFSEGGAVVGMTTTLSHKLAGRLLTSANQSGRKNALVSNPSSLATYDLTQRALALKHRFSKPATLEARSLLKQAMGQDPNYATPITVYCWLNAIDAIFQLTGEWAPNNAEEIVAQCQTSLAIDAYSAMTYIALADAYLVAGKTKEAADSAKRATELAPSDAEAWLMYAFHLLPVELAISANEALNRSLLLFPIKPPFVNLIAAQVTWANSDLSLAKETATACIEAAPHLDMCSVVLALAHTELGDAKQAEPILKFLNSKSALSKPKETCSRFTGQSERYQKCVSILEGIK